MIVVDASALATALVDDDEDGDEARARLAGQALAAPELIDLEVGATVRRLVLSGQLPARRADLALGDLGDLRLRRVSHRPLLPRCWELKDNLTFYDAAYVALAEQLDVVLVTLDEPLSRAPGLRCEVELIG